MSKVITYSLKKCQQSKFMPTYRVSVSSKGLI